MSLWAPTLEKAVLSQVIWLLEGYSAMSGDMFDWRDVCVGCASQWVGARDAAEHPTLPRTDAPCPPAKNCPPLNVTPM